MELASSHPSGVKNFEMASRFLENLSIPGLEYLWISNVMA